MIDTDAKDLSYCEWPDCANAADVEIIGICIGYVQSCQHDVAKFVAFDQLLKSEQTHTRVLN